MEHEIDGVDASEFARAHEVADLPHPFGEAIREIDAEQPVRSTGRIEDGAHFRGGSPERLLAEDGGTAPQRLDRLLRVKPARRGDGDAVDPNREERVEGGDMRCVRRQKRGCGEHVRRGIGQAHDLDVARLLHGLEAVTADPSDPEESDARAPVGSNSSGSFGCIHQKAISALRKDPGRSRVASRAAPSCSSGKRCVKNGAGSSRPVVTASTASRIPQR